MKLKRIKKGLYLCEKRDIWVFRLSNNLWGWAYGKNGMTRGTAKTLKELKKQL